MKIKGGQLPPARTLKLLRGNFQVYGTRAATLVAQKWPRKRGPKGTPAQLAARADFMEAIELIRTPCEDDWIAANNLSPGTGLLPRDLLMMAAFGKLVVANLANGKQLIGYRIAFVDAQQTLNAISTTPGAMLVRTATQWQALLPGTAGDVLTTQGPGALPGWLTPTSSGGGGADTIAMNFTNGNSGTGFATKGSLIVPTTDILLAALWFHVDEVVGGNYIVSVVELTSFTIATVLAQTSPIAATAAQSIMRRFVLSSTATLEAGKRYAVLHTRTDASTTTSSGLYSGTNDPYPAPLAWQNTFVREASKLPSVGDTLLNGASPYHTGLEWAFPPA